MGHKTLLSLNTCGVTSADSSSVHRVPAAFLLIWMNFHFSGTSVIFLSLCIHENPINFHNCYVLGVFVTVKEITITGRQSNCQHVEHCGAQNTVKMACCVSEGVVTRKVELWPLLTNRRLGHREHWILSCPGSSIDRASGLKVEGPGFNFQLGQHFSAHTKNRYLILTNFREASMTPQWFNLAYIMGLYKK